MTRVLMFSTLLVMVAVMCAPAMAEERGAGNQHAGDAESASLWRFGEHDKLCIEWTDGCRTCRRTGAGAADCSNIEIACQPTEARCTSKAGAKLN